MQSPHAVAWELRDVCKTFGPVVCKRRRVACSLSGTDTRGGGRKRFREVDADQNALWGPQAGQGLETSCARSAGSSGPSIAARFLGVATVFQEFSLIPDLTVAENIQLGRWPGRAFKVNLARVARGGEATVLGDLGIEISPDARRRRSL